MSVFRRLNNIVGFRIGTRVICLCMALALVSPPSGLLAEEPGWAPNFDLLESVDWLVSRSDFQGPFPARDSVSEEDLVKLEHYVQRRVGNLDVLFLSGQEGTALLDQMGNKSLGVCGLNRWQGPDGQVKEGVVMVFRGMPDRHTYLHELSHFVGQIEPVLKATKQSGGYNFELARDINAALPNSLTEGFAPAKTIQSAQGDVRIRSVQDLLTTSRRWRFADRPGAFSQQNVLEQTQYALTHTVGSRKSGGSTMSCFSPYGNSSETPKRCVGGARGIKSLFWAPVMMAFGSWAAQAAGVSPEMVDDLTSVPLAPQDLLFAAPSFVWEIYSENHRLPGSKAYEMHLLMEAYKHAPEAFGKCTGISAKGYSDPTFVPPPLPSHIMQQLANPVVPIVSSPSRGALMGCR